MDLSENSKSDHFLAVTQFGLCMNVSMDMRENKESYSFSS